MTVVAVFAQSSTSSNRSPQWAYLDVAFSFAHGVIFRLPPDCRIWATTMLCWLWACLWFQVALPFSAGGLVGVAFREIHCSSFSLLTVPPGFLWFCTVRLRPTVGIWVLAASARTRSTLALLMVSPSSQTITILYTVYYIIILYNYYTVIYIILLVPFACISVSLCVECIWAEHSDMQYVGICWMWLTRTLGTVWAAAAAATCYLWITSGS